METKRRLSQLMKAVPIKQLGTHFCHDSLLWLPIFATVKLAMSVFSSLRLRTHYGENALMNISTSAS